MLTGFWWATYAGKKTPQITIDEEIFPAAQSHPPSTLKAFLPVVVPIVLIAGRSFLAIGNQDSGWLKIFSLAGDPVIALSIGICWHSYRFLTGRKQP
jgi:GntP family gluconate:H+ symporter